MGFIKAPRDKPAKVGAKHTAAVAPAARNVKPKRADTIPLEITVPQHETATPTYAASEVENASAAWWVSDIAFLVEGRAVQAHKVVLASRSDYFNRLFLTQPAAEYTITEVSYDAFSLFIRWIYAGSRDVPASGAADLLKCALVFGVADLREVCETALAVLSEESAQPAFHTWAHDPILARGSNSASPAVPSSPTNTSMLSHDFSMMDHMGMDIAV